MKIEFAKVGVSPCGFSCSHKGVTVAGTFIKRSRHTVEMKSRMKGRIELLCDRCGERYEEEIDLPLDLILTDQIAEQAGNLDTIELLNGEIDVPLLIESEINSFKSAYHYCRHCNEMEKEIDIEL